MAQSFYSADFGSVYDFPREYSVGIPNLGYTCYQNVILQLLWRIKVINCFLFNNNIITCLQPLYEDIMKASDTDQTSRPLLYCLKKLYSSITEKGESIKKAAVTSAQTTVSKPIHLISKYINPTRF